MRVYVCAKVDATSYKYVSEVIGKLLYPEVVYLRPQLGDAAHRMQVAATDIQMINSADELWVVGKFGMDCMWEIGYAIGRGIPVTILVDETNREIVEKQWMIFGSPVKLVELEYII